MSFLTFLVPPNIKLSRVVFRVYSFIEVKGYLIELGLILNKELNFMNHIQKLNSIEFGNTGFIIENCRDLYLSNLRL